MRDNDTSLVRALRGPVTLITVGVLFALNNFTQYRFQQTWPVLLIVFGLLSLVRRGLEPVPPPPGPGYAPPPQYNYQPPAQNPGSFRQSTYNEPPPPAGPVKGGFGSTSTSQRPGEPGENSGGAV